MIPLLSKVLDTAVDRQFRKDLSVRLVFVPFSLKAEMLFRGIRKADEEKIRVAGQDVQEHDYGASPGDLPDHYGSRVVPGRLRAV